MEKRGSLEIAFSTMRVVITICGIFFGLILVLSVWIRIARVRYANSIKPYTSYDHQLFIAKGCDQYKEQYGKWPASFEELATFRIDLSDPWTRDGWGREFLLIPYDVSKGYGSLISYGRDGKPGGSGLDHDLEVRFPTEANATSNERMGQGLRKPDRRI